MFVHLYITFISSYARKLLDSMYLLIIFMFYLCANFMQKVILLL